MISKYMRIGGGKHGNMENELFDFAMLERVVSQWMAKQENEDCRNSP
jgi:hypothetical protein